MAFFAPPAKAEISATPTPSNAVAKAGFGKLWDYLTGLLGATGQPAEALAALKLLDSSFITNIAPTFAAAANALTITMKDKDGNAFSADNPAFVAMRHATLGNGGHNLRKITANFTLTISSGSTLGHLAAVLQPIFIYGIDNGGAVELAVSRSFHGEQGIVTTTAEGGAGAADSATTMYSTAARAAVSFRLLAIAYLTQAVAGTWVNLPTEAKVPPFLLERVGEEITLMSDTLPHGYHAEDGSNVSRTAGNEKLFGYVGTTWGVGDGATTFGLPDSRRRAPIGKGGTGTGTLGNAVGNVGGAETHTLSTTELASHTHILQQGNGVGSGGDFPSGNFVSNIATDAAGGGGAHNNMQPSYVVTKAIRWLGDIM